MKLCPSEADFRPVSGREHHVPDDILAGIEGCGYKDPIGLFPTLHDESGWSGCSIFMGYIAVYSKTYPSFLTVKEGSTFLTKPLFPQGREDVTALLGARNRYALRLADHQRSSPYCAGWDRLE